jgi:hypothetical protein
MKILLTVLVLANIAVDTHIPQLISWAASSPIGKAGWYSVDKNGEALKWYREQQHQQHLAPAPSPVVHRGEVIAI